MEYITISIAIVAMFYAVYKSAAYEDEKLKRLKSSTTNEEDRVEDYFDKVEDRLDKLEDKNPDLGFISRKLKNHLFQIEAQKDKLEYLVTTPEKQPYVKEAYSSFEIVEKQIYQNIEDILNICVAAESKKGKVKCKDVDMDAINAELQSNETKLALTQETLDKLIILINQHDDESTNIDIVATNRVLDTKLDQIVSK